MSFVAELAEGATTQGVEHRPQHRVELGTMRADARAVDGAVAVARPSLGREPGVPPADVVRLPVMAEHRRVPRLAEPAQQPAQRRLGGADDVLVADLDVTLGGEQGAARAGGADVARPLDHRTDGRPVAPVPAMRGDDVTAVADDVD